MDDTLSNKIVLIAVGAILIGVGGALYKLDQQSIEIYMAGYAVAAFFGARILLKEPVIQEKKAPTVDDLPPTMRQTVPLSSPPPVFDESEEELIHHVGVFSYDVPRGKLRNVKLIRSLPEEDKAEETLPAPVPDLYPRTEG